MKSKIIAAFIFICFSINIFAQSITEEKLNTDSASPEFIKVASDNWHFETASSHQTFIPFGVNYYDPKTYHSDPYVAYDVIGKFDSARTDRQLSKIAGLGANIVRIFLSPVIFEPQLFQLKESSFLTLDKLIATAKKNNLYIIFDLIDTWEGEPSWQSWEYFADEQTLQGFEYFLKSIGDRYVNEPTIFSWNLLNEPEIRGPDSGIMVDLFGVWVRFKYGTENNLSEAWDDYPGLGESWQQVKSPPYNAFTEQESFGSTRFYDFQLFREDIAYNWVRRLTDAIRTNDKNHMITVGLDQHSVPFKPDGTFYKTYTAFNPHKIAPLLDYSSTHGYNWWGEYVNEFIEGLMRYSYVNKPVVLEEFNLTELGNTLDNIQRSGSGWLQWAAFSSQADWESCLFDSSEQVTSIGTAFKNIADSVKQNVALRLLDTELIDLDLKEVLVSRMAQDSVYRKYVKAVHNRQSPVGFNLINYQYPNIIKLKVPAEGEVIKVADNLQIQWDKIDWDIIYKTTIDINLSRDGGASWEILATNIDDNEPFNWIVQGPISESCIISVIDHNDSNIFSEHKFSIMSSY